MEGSIFVARAVHLPFWMLIMRCLTRALSPIEFEALPGVAKVHTSSVPSKAKSPTRIPTPTFSFEVIGFLLHRCHPEIGADVGAFDVALDFNFFSYHSAPGAHSEIHRLLRLSYYQGEHWPGLWSPRYSVYPGTLGRVSWRH